MSWKRVWLLFCYLLATARWKRTKKIGLTVLLSIFLFYDFILNKTSLWKIILIAIFRQVTYPALLLQRRIIEYTPRSVLYSLKIFILQMRGWFVVVFALVDYVVDVWQRLQCCRLLNDEWCWGIHEFSISISVLREAGHKLFNNRLARIEYYFSFLI